MNQPEHLVLDITTKEVFNFCSLHFDVRKAKQIIVKNPRNLDSVEVKLLDAWVGGKTPDGKMYMGVTLHSIAKGIEIDLRVPIIWANIEGFSMPIDGWHRIKKALDTGILTLPVYVLTIAESKECLMK